MSVGNGINESAQAVWLRMQQDSQQLNIRSGTAGNGTRFLDCGVDAAGGIQAGLEFASICMAGKAKIEIVSGDRAVWPGPWVQVTTDHPTDACMLGQYAGWPVKSDDFFAMGSGPMRVKRGREELLLSLGAADGSTMAVGTLECDQIPDDAVFQSMADDCGVAASDLYVAIAPTRSLAGCVQVVARSVETALHKLHELSFPLSSVLCAYGLAPLPTPAPDFAKGIGRTNDAILYGGHVSLWVDGDDNQIAEIGKQLPSCGSRDYGQPFSEIFKRYGFDFYKIDPCLFSPAEVTMLNLRSGRSWRFGELREDLIAQSFETEIV